MYQEFGTFKDPSIKKRRVQLLSNKAPVRPAEIMETVKFITDGE
jgi:hypothetical protein